MSLLSLVCDWIGRNTGTIVMVPHPIVVGCCAEEILFGLRKAKREGKKLALLHQYPLPWPMHYRLTNHDLIDVDSEYRAFSRNSPWHVVGSALVTVYAGICRLIHPWLRRLGHPLSGDDYYPGVGNMTLWQPKEVMPGFSWEVVAQYDWPREIHKKVPVYLAPAKKSAGERERRRMGLPDDAWFACLHVREGGFHKDDMVERNANIANYIDAIKDITARGGWVVRMGDASMTKLPPMEQVIDYPFTPSKSYAMDLYLISECRVYIGMHSGIFDVAMLFQRPMITTNMASWFYPAPQKPGDMGLIKHIYSKSRRRFLSLREWISEPFHSTSYSSLGEDYVLHENNPEELKAAVQEFFTRDGNGESTPLQHQFREMRLARGREFLNKPIRADNRDYDIRDRYRIAAGLESAIGLISDDYLKKNWDRDARNPS